MRKNIRTFALAAGAVAALTSAVTLAEARERPRALTVHGRSFTDAGKVPPVGSMRNYVNAVTIYNQIPGRWMRTK
jgi:hypothetical protein